MLRPLFEYDCLVLGCGNPLIGDDGFGPAVIQQLEEAYAIPESVACIDVGTSVRFRSGSGRAEWYLLIASLLRSQGSGVQEFRKSSRAGVIGFCYPPIRDDSGPAIGFGHVPTTELLINDSIFQLSIGSHLALLNPEP